MGRTYQKKGSILLIEGIDTSKPAEYINSQAVRNSENFELSRDVLTKRTGTSVLGSVVAGTDLEIMHGAELTREGVKYNVRVSPDKIQYQNSATTWSDITGSVGGEAVLTAANTDLVSMAVPLLSGKRILCVTNGINDIRKWTGTGNTAVLGGSPPKAKFIQEYKTYLVCANIAGGTDISQRVQWSDTADPEEWSTGNSGTVDLEEDGGDITGLNLYGNYLAVHKTSSIYLGYLVNTTDIFRFDRKATGSGTVAHNTIVNIPTGEQVFLASDGIRVFNGITAPRIPSFVNDEIRDMLSAEFSYRSWAVLVKEKDEVWFGMPIGSQEWGETVYKFNYKKGTVLKDTRSGASAGWLGTNSTSSTWDDMEQTWDQCTDRWNNVGLAGESDQINIGDNVGYTVKVDSTQLDDNSNNINAVIETGDFQHSQDVISRWLRLELWAKGDTVTVEYSTDQGESWTAMGASPFTLSSVYPPLTSPDVFYFDVVGSTIRFRFSNNTSDESLSIKQFIVGYRPRELR